MYEMINIKDTILETTFTAGEPGDGTVGHKLVLHRERNGCITYNKVQTDGSGWETTCFHGDLEKGLKFFLKAVSSDRKSFLGSKDMKIILPAVRAPKRLCQCAADINHYLSEAYDQTIGQLSASERAIVTLLKQGGSWGWRVYEAIPDVIDKILKRITVLEE